MRHSYVFNGDADGIIAAHPLLLANKPHKPNFYTGVKRDIALLAQVPVSNEPHEIWVADISLDSNVEALSQHLNAGATVHYFDHHRATQLKSHANLHAHINQSPKTCSALIVNAYLNHAFASWAVVAAFGDGMVEAAQNLAQIIGLECPKIGCLQALGECINYNAYGDSLADLLLPPLEILQRLNAYANPLDFMENDNLLS